MDFPAYFFIGPFQIHPHWAFECLAYLVGFRLYLAARARRGDVLPEQARLWIVAAAIGGAAVGSKILYWIEDPVLTLHSLRDPVYLMGGKTIVGGLLGGLIAVEVAKRRLGIKVRTGDLFAIPLAMGIAVGRIGCFLSGMSDATYGEPTTLPLGIDLGDGIPRHPVQIYEIVFLLLLAFLLRTRSRRPHPEGDLFRTFMVGYLGFRLLIDFLKPGVPLMGLTAIQWVCAGALLYYGRRALRMPKSREAEPA